MTLISLLLITLPATAAALTTLTGLQIRRAGIAPRTGTALAALPGLTVLSVLMLSIALAMSGHPLLATLIGGVLGFGALSIAALLARALWVRAGATTLSMICAALWAAAAWLLLAAFYL